MRNVPRYPCAIFVCTILIFTATARADDPDSLVWHRTSQIVSEDTGESMAEDFCCECQKALRMLADVENVNDVKIAKLELNVRLARLDNIVARATLQDRGKLESKYESKIGKMMTPDFRNSLRKAGFVPGGRKLFVRYSMKIQEIGERLEKAK